MRRTGRAWARAAALAGAGAAVLCAAPLGAQTAPATGARTPVAPPSRAEVERLPVAPVQRRSGRLTVDGDVERAPCPLDSPRFAAVTVRIDRVAYDGLEQVDAADLAPAAARYLGHTVPIAAICAIRDAAATLLRRRGYLAAVQVPPQRIEDGTVHLTALMAHLVAVHVRGDAGHAEALIARTIEHLENKGPFNQRDAERALLLAGDLPGFDIRLTLRPAGTPGAVVGDITVTRTPFAIDVNVQNAGSHAVGRWSGLVNMEANDLLGLGDRAVLGLYNTADVREQSVVQASYEMRPDASGVSVAGRFTYAWTRPDTGGSDPVRARTLIATAEASYPLVRRQAETLRLAGGLDVVNQRLSFAGLPLTSDRLRTLYARADFSLVDPAGVGAVQPRWRIAGALELRRGLAALGASRGCGAAPLYARCLVAPSISRFDADPQATLVRFAGTVSLDPVRGLTLLVKPRAQYALAPLLSFDQFTIGNYTVGRGYDPGALSGDSGYGAQVEARWGSIPLPHVAGGVTLPFAFVDVARAWNRGTIPAVYDRTSIVSVGGGARLAFRDRYALELLLAKPLGRPPLAGQDHGLRLLASLTGHFDAGTK